MLRTVLVLTATLIALPLLAWHYDAPLRPEQWLALTKVSKGMLYVALSCFFVSELTRNYSQVDKLWSVVPVFYAWFVADAGGYQARLVLMAVCVTIWAARLTFNFARRGGYHWIPWKGEEDYRWAVLKAQNPMLQKRWAWGAFNLFFISLYQHSLILLFTLPIVMAWQSPEQPLNWLDYLAAAMMVGFVVLETVADQQQYDFQTEKYRRIKAGETLDGDYAGGFRTTGLWGKVRHPNYACEQAVWLSFYLFSVAATGRWINWSLAGAILLMLLFIGSSDFSEKISAGKYPGYADYQKKVPRFFPKFGA